MLFGWVSSLVPVRGGVSKRGGEESARNVRHVSRMEGRRARRMCGMSVACLEVDFVNPWRHIFIFK